MSAELIAIIAASVVLTTVMRALLRGLRQELRDLHSEVARIGWTVRRVLGGVSRWLSSPSLSRSGDGKGVGSGEGVNEPVYMWTPRRSRAPSDALACRSPENLLASPSRYAICDRARVRSLLVVEPDPLAITRCATKPSSRKTAACDFRERHSRSRTCCPNTDRDRPSSVYPRSPGIRVRDTGELAALIGVEDLRTVFPAPPPAPPGRTRCPLDNRQPPAGWPSP